MSDIKYDYYSKHNFTWGETVRKSNDSGWTATISLNCNNIPNEYYGEFIKRVSEFSLWVAEIESGEVNDSRQNNDY